MRLNKILRYYGRNLERKRRKVLISKKIFLETKSRERNLLIHNNVEKLYKFFYYQGNYNLTFLWKILNFFGLIKKITYLKDLSDFII